MAILPINETAVSEVTDVSIYSTVNVFSESGGYKNKACDGKLNSAITNFLKNNTDNISWEDRGNLNDRDIVRIKYKGNTGNSLETFYRAEVPTKLKFRMNSIAAKVILVAAVFLVAGLVDAFTGGGATSIGVLMGLGGLIAFCGLMASFDLIDDKTKKIMLKRLKKRPEVERHTPSLLMEARSKRAFKRGLGKGIVIPQ